jgi:hypothetical protein
LVVVSAIEYVPLPGNADAGSTSSAHRFAVTAGKLPRTAPRAGLLFQVIVVSPHVAVTAETRPPSGLASVLNNRRRAAVEAPLSPVTVKRRYTRYSGLGARTCSCVRVPWLAFSADDVTWASALARNVVVAARVTGTRIDTLHAISIVTVMAAAMNLIGRNGWGRAARGSCWGRANPPCSSR